MTPAQALRVALDCMERERRRYVFEANVAKEFGETLPAFANARKKYDRITEAMAVLEALRDEDER